ncbi:MAG TPA: PilZ domain-containing protein [Thermodesulfobacteriota bacterium]|nr:PilZ domain-containing protein [Thermodesulfobacteriota bacterium]
MSNASDGKEKRKYPRVLINMPLDFKVTEDSSQSTGLVINASEAGLLIQTFKDMPIGRKIIVEVSFSNRLKFERFSAMTEIVWKDIYVWDDWEAYQYGLKFSQISYEDYLTLKQILSSQSNLEAVTFGDELNHKERLIIKTR